MTGPGIIWLASYPKSGNTWVRAFLANYMLDREEPVPIDELVGYSIGDGFVIHYERMTGRKVEEMTEAELHALRPKMHAWLAQSRGQDIFVKTHNLLSQVGGTPLITPAVTAGAVYILRNPLDVAVSYADHYRVELGTAVAALCEANHVVPGTPRALPQYLGSWSQHVRSWVDAPGLSPLVLRYEDLLSRPAETFGALARFLRWPPDQTRLDKAVRFSAFDELAGQEEESGFRELPKGATTRFFRAGRTGAWRDALSDRQTARMIEANGALMRRFGYLGEDGRTPS